MQLIWWCGGVVHCGSGKPCHWQPSPCFHLFHRTFQSFFTFHQWAQFSHHCGKVVFEFLQTVEHPSYSFPLCHEWRLQFWWVICRDACPAPGKKQALPRPAKLTKSAGRSGAKLTADSIDTPFHYARKWCLKGRKSRKIFSFFFFYILWLSSSQKYLLKVKGDNVFTYQNIMIHYKYLHHNLRTFYEFLDQSIYAFFCPALPRRFSASPCPADFYPRLAPLEKILPRPSLVERTKQCPQQLREVVASGHAREMAVTRELHQIWFSSPAQPR